MNNCNTYILACLADILPVTSFRDIEAVVFRKVSVFKIAARMFKGSLSFFIVNIR